jgi:hypothetical protein
MPATNTPTALRDVLYAFSLAKPVPDARLLDEFVRRYPQHAAEITDFAIELAIDAAQGGVADVQEAEPTVSPAVSRAMSRFQNRLFALRQDEESGSASSATASSSVENPFAALDRTAFRGLANRLKVSTLFVAKLRDRQIDPNTMTTGFRKRVANELSVPLDVVISHFAAQSEAQPRQFYKAEQNPTTVARQSFEEAVRSSGLTEEQQRHLMNM